jgi:hypothetical protein
VGTGPEDENPVAPDFERIAETSKESLGKLHSLVDELKTVQEHEKCILDD